MPALVNPFAEPGRFKGRQEGERVFAGRLLERKFGETGCLGEWERD